MNRLIVLLILLGMNTELAFAASHIELLRKATVLIRSTGGDETTVFGSGIFINKDGLILTNAHLFFSRVHKNELTDVTVYMAPDGSVGVEPCRENLEGIGLFYSAEREVEPETTPHDIEDCLIKNSLRNLENFKAKVILPNLNKDLALLKPEINNTTRVFPYSNKDLALLKLEINNTTRVFPYLVLGDSNKVDLGDQVWAVGHSKSQLWNLKKPMISQRVKIEKITYFVSESRMAQGYSGSGLINRNGHLIGLNSFKSTGKNSREYSNYSISSNVVRAWLNDHGLKNFYKTPRKFHKIELPRGSHISENNFCNFEDCIKKMKKYNDPENPMGNCSNWRFADIGEYRSSLLDEKKFYWVGGLSLKAHDQRIWKLQANKTLGRIKPDARLAYNSKLGVRAKQMKRTLGVILLCNKE